MGKKSLPILRVAMIKAFNEILVYLYIKTESRTRKRKQIMNKLFLFFFTIAIFNSAAYGNEQCCERPERCEKTPCNEKPVRSYTEPSGLYIALMGMYAVPTETGLGTFNHSLGYANSSGGVTCSHDPIKLPYKPAGGIQLGYDFGGSANRLELAYFYLHNSKHNTHTPDDAVTFGSAFFNIGAPLTPGASLPPSELKYTLNQGDIRFGHRLIAGSCFFEFTPLIGVRYALLKHNLPFTGGYVKSSYSGAGPLMGFDLIYNMYKGFLLVGQFDASLLMGSVKSSSSLTLGSTNSFHSPSNRRIVSNFESRLGLAYDFLYGNHASSLRIEAGYEMNQYIEPFDMLISYVAPVQRISDLETTSFAYSGPYLRLMWHM